MSILAVLCYYWMQVVPRNFSVCFTCIILFGFILLQRAL